MAHLHEVVGGPWSCQLERAMGLRGTGRKPVGDFSESRLLACSDEKSGIEQRTLDLVALERPHDGITRRRGKGLVGIAREASPRLRSLAGLIAHLFLTLEE